MDFFIFNKTDKTGEVNRNENDLFTSQTLKLLTNPGWRF